MQQKTILIVGGAGFIGSHVNKQLSDQGYNTIVLDNLSRGNKRSVVRGTFLRGDTCRACDLDAVFESYPIDAVMHFAANTDVGESVINPSKYYANNVTSTLSLLDAMVRHEIKAIVFSSTAAVYGNPVEIPITEKHPQIPINPYGHTKLMIEQILSDYDHAYQIKSCCLRYFNAAGGDPDEEIKQPKRKENNLIPIALRSLQQECGSISVFGSDYDTEDGTCVRDYIHVNDLGSAHITAVEQLLSGAASSFYNLGNGNGYSVKEVLSTVEEVTGLKLDITQGARRQGDPPFLIADANKAKKALQWKPSYPDLYSMVSHAWKAMQ